MPKVDNKRPSLELIRYALGFISPGVDRDTWLRIAMAIKSEFPDDNGFAAWNDWSAGDESYVEQDARSVWRSVAAEGGVTIATLFALAKEGGFELPATTKAQIHSPARPGPSQPPPQSGQGNALERTEVVASAARRYWDRCAKIGDSRYLSLKCVKGHGVRYDDGVLVVPMRDPEGVIRNVQRILTDPPRKLFMAGGRKRGLWHWVGSPEGAPVLLAAEGYATSATLHEATGRPVAVAFDAGNLLAVAGHLRERYPTIPLLICGDDDIGTQKRRNVNPGRRGATQAAQAAATPSARAAAVFPVGLAEGGTDFNDLAVVAGTEAVRRIIEAACKSLLGPGDVVGPGGESSDSDREMSDRRFSIDESGVWFDEGSRRGPMWLCSPLHVTAQTRGSDGNGWGYLLKFCDPDGNPKTWAMPAAMLAGDGSEWAARLRDMGLRIEPGSPPRHRLAQYIDGSKPSERATCTDRLGWHGTQFVMPDTSIGMASDGSQYVFQTDTGVENPYRHSGTLEQWQTGVARLAAGNTRLVFTIACAFAGPLLKVADMEGGGFHLLGTSSTGKTTALKVAASVWGAPSYMRPWRTTDNALESTATQHCDSLLVLDEFSQIDPRIAGESAYLLANGQDKARSTRSGLARKRRSWCLLFLSSGEMTLANHMAETGRRARAGMEVRMVDIPLDAGRGMGGLEELHGVERGAEFADAIALAAARSFGTAGLAWLEWVCAHREQVASDVLRLRDQCRDAFVPEAASEQVNRVGLRFALVGAAGEIATRAGITGWESGEARTAAKRCFDAWLAERGHLENGEAKAMLALVRGWCELHADARLTWLDQALDEEGRPTSNRGGFKRKVDEAGHPVKPGGPTLSERKADVAYPPREKYFEYLIFPGVFRDEICKGYPSNEVLRVLAHHGFLITEAINRFTCKPRLPGMGPTRIYRISSRIHGPAESDGD